MVSKRLSPEYFRRVCETIHRHNWHTDFAYRSLFRKFMFIFDYEDVKAFNELCQIFAKRWYFQPEQMDRYINHMMASGRIIRVTTPNGDKIYIDTKSIDDMEDIVRWCHKKLNEYYIKYGLSIDGIEGTSLDTFELYD